MELERSELPGIGQKYTFVTRKGRQVGLVTHRTGERDLLVYDKNDPDRCAQSVTLSAEESEVLGELLMAARVVERQADFERGIEGLVTERIQLDPASPYVARELGETRARTRTGASIVAVVRAGEVIPSPEPRFRLQADDVIVAVGTAEATRALTDILVDG